MTSIAVIGLYIAYVLHTWLRLRRGDAFERGPWHLGRFSRPIGAIAVAWVAFISVLFMLPTVSPVGWSNFNYTPVAVLAVLGFAGGWWLVSARRWFSFRKVPCSRWVCPTNTSSSSSARCARRYLTASGRSPAGEELKGEASAPTMAW